jgi:hypothetical protein
VSKGLQIEKKTLMSKGIDMSWLIKTDENKFEIWTDEEYRMKKQKCEYYGSKPSWTEIKQMENTLFQNAYQKTFPSTNNQFLLDLI